MKKNILVVEDEIVTAMDIKEALLEFGFNVIGVATNIKKALKLLEENSCDLALLDITLKNGDDGITLSETITKNYDIPFVFLTANDKYTTIERAIKNEPYGYIIKPFKDAELKATVELALKKFSDKKELTTKLEDSQKHYVALEKNIKENSESSQKRFKTLKFGYVFDKENRKLFLEDAEINLNQKEIKLFEILIKNENCVVANDAIEDYLYDGELVGEGALRGVLFRLRQKINKNLISNHSKMGYKIETKTV
ncbi:response regulator [Halarcobacter sp.]|uniref:response regulator transcription factor n=1 Tax=Halarcobacter sp. TaxID=2321133 RepID=UPI0029F4BE3A|nr:response regulator [Halarcobacter sp.]